MSEVPLRSKIMPVMKRTELPPPTCYIKTLLIKKVEDGFNAMKEMLSDSLTILEKQESLTMESYVLSRMVYKMNSQWRREKSMQGLKRIKTCLNRYKDLKLIEYVAELKDHFDGCDLYLGEVYLPAQHMIVYLLRQMMCLARLMTQMCNYCKYTYVYISQNISIGNFIPQNMVFLSMVSRIWALGKSLGLHSVRWYEGIYKCLDVFPQTQVQTVTEDLPSTLSSFLTTEEFQSDSLEDNISPSPEDLSIDPDEDMDAQPEAQWEEDTSKKDIVETSKPEIFVKEKILEKRSKVNNGMELSESEDLGDVVVRQAPKSHTLRRDSQNNQIADDENVEDLGLLVSRKELSYNCDNFDKKNLKQEIVNCKSFKKLKDMLKQFDDFDKNAPHLKTCENKLRELKKEHLLLKRNGFKDNQFIEQAKEELIKLINLSKDDKILEETCNEPLIKKDIVDIAVHVSEKLSNSETVRKSNHRDFSIEEIFKKPYKNLLKLVEDQGIDTSSKKRQTKVKKCSVNVKTIRKQYMEESKKKKKKQYVKLAEEKVQTVTEDLPSTLSSFLTTEEFQSDSLEDNISPSPEDLSIDPDEDMDAQPEAQWEEDTSKKDIVETSKPEIFVKEKILEKRSKVNNGMELSESEDLGDVVVRQAPKSHTLRRDSQNNQIADDENVEDLGLLVSRKELSYNCDNFDKKNLKQEIVNCKSFKKLKDMLKQFDDFDKNAPHLKTCENKLRELKKEHLLLKRNGFKDNQFIEQAKEELIKLINLSKDDKILEETCNEPLIKKDIVDIVVHVSEKLSNSETVRKSNHRDFSIEEIFKKPYKNLLKLVEDQGIDTSSKKRQTKVKKCSVNVKTIRKQYMEESKKKKKKQYVKLAEEKVIELLNSFS